MSTVKILFMFFLFIYIVFHLFSFLIPSMTLVCSRCRFTQFLGQGIEFEPSLPQHVQSKASKARSEIGSWQSKGQNSLRTGELVKRLHATCSTVRLFCKVAVIHMSHICSGFMFIMPMH